MRKEYVKPSMVAETYQLSESIAAGCETTVNLDPITCDWFQPDTRSRSAFSQIPEFAPETCGCTYTAATTGYFTS